MSNKQETLNNGEIDLCEVYAELRKNVTLILKVTFTFILVAMLYVFLIASPVYEYKTMIRLPATVSSVQANSFVEIFKDDIKPDEELKDKKNKLTDVRLIKNTSVIQFVFEGESNERAKELGEKYVNEALEKVNGIIVEQEKSKFTKEQFIVMYYEVSYISSRLRESVFTEADAANRLNYLVEKLETREINKMYLSAEIAKDANLNNNPISPQKGKIILLAAITGLLMSSIYIILRLLLQK